MHLTPTPTPTPTLTLTLALTPTPTQTQIKAFKREVDKRRSQMTNYIFFLRVTPFLPNTFINVCSPVVHVPYSSFAVGGLLGLLPNNVMAIKVCALRCAYVPAGS